DAEAALAVALVAELEGAGGAEADRADHRVGAQLRLVVAVPGDAVTLAAVQVEQHAVERHYGDGLDLALDGQQRVGPRLGMDGDAGIAVRLARLAVPGRQPRQVNQLAVEVNLLLLPVDSLAQLAKQPIALVAREER